MASKRTWLLLRGLTRGQGHWAEFPSLLQRKFPDDEVLFIDLPGNGSQSFRSSPWRMKDYVEFIRETLHIRINGPGTSSREASAFQGSLKFAGSLNLVAVSLGAMVAVEWMQLYPDEVARAYLLNTSFNGSGAFYERLLPANYLRLIEILKSPDVLAREKMILQMTSRNLQAQEKWLSEFGKYSAEHRVSARNFFRQLVAASKVRIPPQAPGKIKLLVSRNDNFVSSKCSFRTAERWGLTPLVHPWAGHDLTLDDPQWVLEQID